MRKLFNLCFFLFATCVFAQKMVLSGTVKDAEGQQIIPFANLIVSDFQQNVLGFSSTDKNGEFIIEIPKEIQKVYINVTALNYLEFFTEHDFSSGTKIILFLEPSEIDLEEIVITVKAYQDVLNLNMEEMNLSKTASLRDILNKTDGVIVSKDGGISFQGKPINKILINGKEVFLNQNKIALDNLNYEIMDTLQIINNFKDRFSLDYSGQKESVINIKTKSEFKGVLKSEIEAGYGFKDSYRLYGKGFLFSDKLNAFVTTGINNIGKREISGKDIPPKIYNNLSSKFNTTLNPFFMEDFQMSKNNSSNVNLTLRWEAKKSKIGLVFNNANIDTERKTSYSTSEGNQLLSQGTFDNSEKGGFYAATLNYDRIITSKTVLNNVFSLLALKNTSHRNSMDSLFYPKHQNTADNIAVNPRNLALSNNLKLSTILNKNSLIDIYFDLYHEKNKNSLDAKLASDLHSDVYQNDTYLKNSLFLFGNHQLKLNKSTFNSGIGFNHSEENADQIIEENLIRSQQIVKRSVNNIESRFALTGTIKKLEYHFSLSPVLFFSSQYEKKSFLKTNNRLTYNFQPQNNLVLTFDRSYSLFDINSMYDTIIQSYNNRTINSFSHLNNFSHTNQASIGWYFNQVPKNRSFLAEYKFKQERNFMQTVLASISDKTFYYSNQIFNDSYKHHLNFGFNKSFYIGESYHRLTVGTNLKVMKSKYNTKVNNAFSKVDITTWNPEIHIGFLPRNSFVKEIKNTSAWNQQIFRINHAKITTQRTFNNTFSIRGHDRKVEWNLDLIYNHYNTKDTNFGVLDLGVFLKYDFNDKISTSISGHSLFSLFELNNFNSVYTQNEGNILSKTLTKDNLGYLLFNVSYKL